MKRTKKRVAAGLVGMLAGMIGHVVAQSASNGFVLDATLASAGSSLVRFPDSAAKGRFGEAASVTTGVEAIPVSGSITIHGNTAVVSNGAAFVTEPFAPDSGELGPGAFVVPQQTTSVDLPFYGALTATYELVQTNTSTATVTSHAGVTLTNVLIRLDVLHAELNGSVLPLGTCSAGPLTLQFAGAVETRGMMVRADQFTIPAFSGCGIYGQVINLFFNGVDNSAVLFLDGEFMPRHANVIFIDWFEP